MYVLCRGHGTLCFRIWTTFCKGLLDQVFSAATLADKTGFGVIKDASPFQHFLLVILTCLVSAD